jgi:hypothetical protein
MDESGTSSLKASDQAFALGGVSIMKADEQAYIAKANEIKTHFFGRTDITFHEPKMRKHEDHFSFGGNEFRQAEFDREFRSLLESTPFVVFAVGIRKSSFLDQYIQTSVDPYLPSKVYDVAIMLLLERYVDYLSTTGDRQLGRANLESIGAREDAEHQAIYADLLLHGTQFVPEKTFQSWLEGGCRFSPKMGTNPAELADLVAREMFEWTRSDCRVEPMYWDIVSSRAYVRGDGHFGRFGIKVFPTDDDMSDDVIAHRAKWTKKQ